MTRTRNQLPRAGIICETMRRRSEEAAAASVHHASLSQQYLLLSQKFATLADQSIDPQFANDLSLVHAAQAIADTLDRESHTGVSQTAFPFPLRREPRNSPEPARQRQALAQPINSPQPQPQYNRSHGHRYSHSRANQTRFRSHRTPPARFRILHP